MDGMWDDEARLNAEGLSPETLSTEEVRRRFAWARRQGRPAWLWPDVPIESWRAALATIQDAAAAMLGEGATAPLGEGATAPLDDGTTAPLDDGTMAPLGGDAAALGLAGYTSGMGPLLGVWVEQGRLLASPAVTAELARHLAHNRRRAARMQAASIDIAGRLAAHGIAVLLLKGAHTGAAYFPEPGARPASDIDLLVAPGDAARTEAVLTQLGFVAKTRRLWESSWCLPEAGSAPRSLTFVHADDPWSVDLHSALKITVGSGTALADFDLAAPMASTRSWWGDVQAGVLDQPLLLLHLAAHAGAGWQNLTLLRLVELVLVIRRDVAQDRLQWNSFLDTGKRIGALGYAYPALRLAEQLVPQTVPQKILVDCAAQAPRAVRRRLERLTPATAQRIERNSVAEHFMWAEGWQGRLRLLASDLRPAVRAWPDAWRIYEDRAWRVIRGTLSQ
jgi:hypothetical protein